MYEKSFVMIKPDGNMRHLLGRIIQRFEDVGLKIHAMKFMMPSQQLVEEHYAEHKGKSFLPRVIKYVTSGPVVAMVIGGNGSISRIRTIVGKTTPSDAGVGTIRGDFCHEPLGDYVICNLVHASADADDAQREISLWFDEDEICDYSSYDDHLHGR
ncbi:MAG: nucleoside-diphosphate kinase [Puniceicoccaceae bacterium]